ncbi:hypothetical protein [Laspinema olomoucense]|uniref:DUF5666 domain-containing protein n=1 Tax=Laspinema olomoucense D3b TaxID=2953688 RepID=A0ABT2N8R1_9CYAN|nr:MULTISPECIES: hypothetical protein [unclassified Laspinema]MCT7979084.1 hypothetical protein [Laspinema sp. D3b]MCT7992837.1 hypothetical protein [Laspinema sp. D3c]
MLNNLTPLKNKTRMGNKMGVAIALALMTATLVPGLPRKAAAQMGTEPANSSVLTLENVAGSPEEFYGQTVTIRGDFKESIDDNAFKLTRGGFLFFGGSEVLVVNNTGQPLVPPENENISLQVTGEVRQMRVAELEKDFGWDFWNPDQYVEYDQRPVIVAESIALAPDPSQIADNPEEFYGRTIAVEGELNEYFNFNAMLLQQDKLIGGGDVLVLLPPEANRINAGEDIVVTGEVRPFVMADIERDLDIRGWTPEMQRLLSEEFENRPVMLAENVYQVGEED